MRNARFAILVMAIAMANPAGAHASPSNDSRDGATVVRDLPFTQTSTFDGATRDVGEVDCDPQIAVALNAPTVWFEFKPTAAVDVLARTTHWPAALYRGLDRTPTMCAAVQATYLEPSDTYAMTFTAVPGELYFLQVIVERTLYPTEPSDPTSLSLSIADHTNVGVHDLRAEVVDATEDLTGAVWDRVVSWSTKWPLWSNVTVGWTAYSCPVAHPTCSKLAVGEYFAGDFGTGPGNSFRWNDVGCVGAVELKLAIQIRDAVDTDATDDQTETVVRILVDEPGVGVCPLH